MGIIIHLDSVKMDFEIENPELLLSQQLNTTAQYCAFRCPVRVISFFSLLVENDVITVFCNEVPVAFISFYTVFYNSQQHY